MSRSRIARLITVLLTMICGDTQASSEDTLPLTLNAPKDWSGETIKLPPGFARDMKFTGVEVIRFAPGMFKPDSDSFFSYAFVFHLPNAVPPDHEALERELLKYYRGLASAVGGAKGLKIDTATFTLRTLKKKDAVTTQIQGEEFPLTEMTLQWVEPFATGKAQTLQMEVVTGKCADATDSFVFMCVSPANKKAKIWKELRDIRTKFGRP